MNYKKYLNEMNLEVRRMFSDIAPNDKAIDKIIDYVKSKGEKKLPKEIDKFFIDYYRKMDTFESKIASL